MLADKQKEAEACNKAPKRQRVIDSITQFINMATISGILKDRDPTLVLFFPALLYYWPMKN